MSWARVMAPLSGGQGDAEAAEAAAMLAGPFGAELAGVYTPADVADVMPWMGEGFLGGVQTTALESLKEAAAVGAARARETFDAVSYAKKQFIALETPVWAGLSAEARLSDVVVFAGGAARGKGALAESFQQILADEQRPVLIARPGLKLNTVAVAWDGGKEASRAARLALPLLERAKKVVILAAPKASSRTFDPARLQAYYAARNVKAKLEVLDEAHDAAPALLRACEGAKVDVMVAGAFGHTRLQEFIVGGATRTLLHSDQPSLFLSH
jgi:nucleotide-binding universal stress UspA family protein